MKPILKILIPICFLGLIGFFVWQNSRGAGETVSTPQSIQPASDRKANEKEPNQDTKAKSEALSDTAKPSKTNEKLLNYAKEQFITTEAEKRRVIMSSSKSMQVSPALTPYSPTSDFKLEPAKRKTIMSSTKSTQVKFDPSLLKSNRTVIMPSTKSAPVRFEPTALDTNPFRKK
ncbi:MAG: hypothetical protein QE487_12915 [Fluviicola sp.]|nr:hypothetical protein [Fluviicola sp.]